MKWGSVRQIKQFKGISQLIMEVKAMMSSIPTSISMLKKEEVDKEILRAGMIAELDAVSLYEQLAAMAENQAIKKVLLDIAKEEKTHMGEFQALLLKLDEEQVKELEKGRKEVEELND
jgi:rubrerythrin